MREAPSYEGAILDTLQAGQAVTFLEDVGGWYKVEANGYVGYVGARFFN
ncbi:SH3 domain-containing protein [Robinsoniella sp.]